MNNNWIKEELYLSLGYYFYVYQKNTREKDLKQFADDLNKKTNMGRNWGAIKKRFSNFDTLNTNKTVKGYENSGQLCRDVWYTYTNESIPTQKLNDLFYDFINEFVADKSIYKSFLDNYKKLSLIDIDDLDVITTDNIVDMSLVDELDYYPKEKPSLSSETKKSKFIRNHNESEKVIKYYKFKCNLDENHKSFISKNGEQYMEAHHLIPFECQDSFSNSIDCAANIVCLCPNCHRKLHHGRDIEQDLLKLYEDRRELLKKAGIKITFDNLIQYYK